MTAHANEDIEERGVTPLLARHDDEAKRLLTEASLHTSVTLAEIESRSHYVHNLRGDL